MFYRFAQNVIVKTRLLDYLNVTLTIIIIIIRDNKEQHDVTFR